MESHSSAPNFPARCLGMTGQDERAATERSRGNGSMGEVPDAISKLTSTGIAIEMADAKLSDQDVAFLNEAAVRISQMTHRAVLPKNEGRPNIPIIAIGVE